MFRWIVWGLCSLLAACASAPPPPVPTALFHDERFEPPSRPVDPTEVFAFNDAMREYLRTELAPRVRSGQQRALIEALYKPGHLKLDYDSATTRNAHEAFDARAGNCLSLVIMTAAFAKELGFPVTYQSAVLDETWSRSGNLYFASGHVNIVLGRPISHRDGLDSEDRLTIDFLPPDEIRGLKTRPIEERTVVAMFLNNRAAEALAAGRVADAYWLSREAIKQASDFLPAYNTLGVVYLQNGATADAEQAFAWALQKEPDNRQAMANMVTTLRREGRDPEADKLKQRLASLEPEPPYHFFNLGIAAFQAGDFSTAQRWFAKEVDRASYNHEFHFWLAMAELRLGELNAARRELKFALDNSTTRGDHDLYAAKLGRLNAMRRQQ